MLLVQKPNRIKRPWYTHGTSGAGEAFLKSFPKVVQLWQTHILTLTTGYQVHTVCMYVYICSYTVMKHRLWLTFKFLYISSW